jgi:thiol-disulfide isomerase/thioredoxin
MSLKFMTLAALLLCALMIGCGTDSAPITSKATNYEVADDSTDATTSEVAAPTGLADAAPVTPAQEPPRRPEPMNQTPADRSDPADIVGPTTEQLLTVIRRLRQQQPNGANQEDMITDFKNLQTQLIQAVDMLLELKPSDDAITEAASAKIDALSAVSRLGAEGAMDQLFAFTEELEKHPSEKVSAFARQQSFVTLLNAFSTDQVTDSQQVIDAYKKLAAEQPKEGGLLTFGRDVSSRFVEKGMNKEAAELLRYTAELVQPTEDPRLGAAADSLIEQARFAELDLGTKLNAVAEKKEGAIEEFTKMLGELTSGEKVGATTLQTIMQIGSMLEPQHGDAAAKVYDVLETSLGKSSDEEVAAVIKETIDKYRLRSAIVGNPFNLEGQLLDGTPFDWNQYKGKVVLVDFWATWCGPCLKEMPNIRENYEKYREQGFEVVGVNLDDDVQELKDFSSLQPLPWPSVLSADPNAVGWEHPMVARNGVAAIPFLVLVDRDGTALALNTRGPALGEKLAELFPDAASTGETPAATEPDEAAPAPEKPATEKPATADTESAPETPAAAAPKEAADSPEPAPSE